MNRRKSIAEKKKRNTLEKGKIQKIRNTGISHYPEPLQELDESERIIYNRLCDHLIGTNSLYDADAFVLTMTAVNLDQIRQIIPELRKKKSIQEFKNGTRNVSPEYSIFEKCNALFLRHSKVLGLDLRSRQELLMFLDQGEDKDKDNVRKIRKDIKPVH